MKVLYDGKIFEKQYVGGISRVFIEIINRVSNYKNISIYVLTTRPWKNHYRFDSSNIKYINLPNMYRLLRPGKLFGRSRAYLEKLLKSTVGYTGFDLWHSTEYTAPIFSMPSVVTIHDMIPELIPNSVDSDYRDYAVDAKRRAVQKADIIIAVSKNTKRDLIEVYPWLDENKIRVVYNSYDRDVFYPRSGGRENYILYIGGRSEYKGFDTLTASLNEWESMPEYRLTVVGRKMTQDELGKCNFEVESLSSVTDDQLAKLYSSATALVYPSLYEGFGLPLLEAMACGAPVVASSIPSTREIAGSVAYYFTPGNPRELMQALNGAVSRHNWPHRQQQMSDILMRYNWDKSVSEIVEAYRALIHV